MGSLTHTVGGSDNLVSFKSAARVPIESLKTYFKPKQDLHGYSKPWGPGCGKNLLDTTDCTPTFDSYRVSSGTVYCGSIAGGNGSRQWFDQVFPAGTYTISAKFSGSVSNIRFLCDKELQNWTWNQYYNGYYSPNVNSMTFTASESFSVGVILSTLSDDHIGEPGTAYDIQLEEGSTATSYEPYSNICPIEGWNGVNIYKAGKSIVPFLVNSRTESSSLYVGYNGWCNSWKVPDRNATYCYSVYIDNTNGEDTAYAEVWYRNIDDTDYDRSPGSLASVGNVIQPGDAGWSTIVINIQNRPNTYYIIPGLTLRQGSIASNPMVTVGNTRLNYEPYCGDIVPVTFPVTGKNIADPTRILCENRMQVSDGVYSNVDTDTREYAQLQIQLYYEDARTYIKTAAILNNITTTGRKSLTFEVDDPECKYIAFKHNGVVRDLRILVPFDYGLGTYTFSVDLLSADPTTIGGFSFKDIQIELGDTATSYEPYSSDNTFYGGYVDVAAGEVVAEYKLRHLDGTEDWLVQDGASGWAPKRIVLLYVEAKDGKYTGAICNKLAPSNNWVPPIYGIVINNNGHLIIGMPEEIQTSQDGKDWLQSIGGIDIIYKLTDPIHYPIPKQQLNTYLNNNSVWSDTNDVTKVSYALHDTGPIRASKRRIAMNQPHIETSTGNSATFSTDMHADIKSAKAYFGPVQDLHGYDAPWHGGGGKNLFDESTVIYNTWTNANGTVNSNVSGCRTIDIEVIPGDTYTAMYKGEQPYSASLIELDSNKDFILRTHEPWIGSMHPDPVQVTLNANTRYIYLQVAEANLGQMTSETLATYKIQLEKGSASTSYASYENICPITGWNNITAHHGNKNLLDVTQYRWGGTDGIHEATSNGSVYTESVYSSNATYIWFTQIFPAGTYTMSCDYSGEGMTGPRFMCTEPFDGGLWNVFYKGYWINFTGRSHTFTANKPFSVGLGFISRSGHTYEPGTIYNIQLETGSVATTFKPYSAMNISVNFPAIGENLFDKTSGNILNAYLDGSKIANVASGKLIYIKCNPSTTYIINKTAGQRFSVAYTTELPANNVATYKFSSDHTVSSITYTTGSDAQYLVAFVYNGNYDTITAEEMIDSVQVLTKTVYGGYVDLVNGELVVEWIADYIKNLSISYSTFKDSNVFLTKHIDTNLPTHASRIKAKVICDRFKPISAISSYSSGATMNNGEMVRYLPSDDNRIFFKDTNYTVVEDFLAVYGDALVAWNIAEPIHYQLTSQQLKTLRGTNNIWSDANGNVEVKYWKH